MSSERHNGWTNYETWAVNLWLTNDEHNVDTWEREARTAWRNADADKLFTRDERASQSLSELLKSEIEEITPDLGATMFADLLQAALSSVNWYEIARNMIDGVDKDDDVDAEDDE